MKSKIAGVPVTYWNPRSRRLGGLPLAPRVRNFGDLLGPWIVRRMVDRLGLQRPGDATPALITVGTIMYLAPEGATVWGTGSRDTVPLNRRSLMSLDVRAVRGPLTASMIRDYGVQVPEIYGDPGLLVAALEPHLLSVQKQWDVSYVPNYADFDSWRAQGVRPLINPRGHLDRVLGAIAASKAIVASSLHALILADALQIPATRVASGQEGDFKYHDYALGAGRPIHEVVSRPVDGVHALASPPSIDVTQLTDSFPSDLWSAQIHGAKAE